jgi:hypothetical protein
MRRANVRGTVSPPVPDLLDTMGRTTLLRLERAAPRAPAARSVARALALLLALALPASAQLLAGGQQSSPALSATRKLPATYECQDGEVNDLATYTPIGAPQSAQRLWIAQGHVRAALDATNGARQFAEDRRFETAQPGEGEKVLDVEVDEAGWPHYLYTATELTTGSKELGTHSATAVVYREQISAPYSPGAPGDRRALAIPLALHEYPVLAASHNESVRELRVWRAANKVVLLTSTRVLVIDSEPQAELALRSANDELDQGWAAAAPLNQQGYLGFPDCSALPERARAFFRLKLFDENGEAPGGVCAAVLTTAFGYCQKPLPRIVLICALSGADETWNAPSFDADPSAARRYPHWNPVETSSLALGGCLPLPSVNCAATPCATCAGVGGGPFQPGAYEGYSAYDLDPFIDVAAGGLARAWVACGLVRQVRRIELSGAFSNPAHDFAPLAIPLGASNPIFKIRADPDFPAERFFALTFNSAHIASKSGPGWSIQTLASQTFGQDAGQRDVPLSTIEESGGGLSRLWWSAPIGQNDYVLKALDVTIGTPNVPKLYDPPSTPAGDRFRFPWIAACDGAAAWIEPEAGRYAIYLPTFGGLMRYEPVGPQLAGAQFTSWREVASSYISTIDLSDGGLLPTEQLEIFELAPGERRLIMAIGTGGFLDWPIDPLTLNPLPFKRYEASAQWLAAAGWVPGGYYGHHALPFEHEGNWYVAVDLANQGNNEVALQIFRRVPGPNPSWCLTGVFVQRGLGPAGGLPTENFSFNVNIARSDANGKVFAFLTFEGGFTSIDLAPSLTSCPAPGGHALVIQNGAHPGLRKLPTDAQGTHYNVWQVERVRGTTPAQDRLVVATDHGLAGTHLFLYGYDDASGFASAQPLWQSTPADFAPNEPSGGLFNARFVAQPGAQGAGVVCLPDRGGFVHFYRWNPSLPNSLAYRGRWKSAYDYIVQDAKPYAFLPGGGGVRVLAPKDREGFALIAPPLFE